MAAKEGETFQQLFVKMRFCVPSDQIFRGIKVCKRDNVVILMLLHVFSPHTLWSRLVRMGLMKMKTAVREHRLSRR